MKALFPEPQVIFEDSSYLVLNKPAGWLSVPARHPDPSHQVLSQWLGSRAPFVVHRLDRFTSGIMLFAKTKTAHETANRWFMNREVKKVYHLLASPQDEQPMPSRPAIQIKTPIEGKPAQTLFEIIQKGTFAFYAKATPLTGRFHQIREHALEAGFPLLGDRAYHGREQIADSTNVVHSVPRVMLHAQGLTLPFGQFEADLPNDFLQVLDWVIAKQV